MKSVLWAMIALVMGAAPCAAAPLAVFGRSPVMSDVALSPDGEKIAFISDVDGKQRVLVQDIATGKPVASVTGGEFKIRSVQWADDDNVIVVSSRLSEIRGAETNTLKNEYSQGAVLSVSENKVSPLLHQNDAQSLPVLLGRPMARRIDGVTSVFTESVAFVATTGRSSIFRTDLRRRRTILVQAGEPTTSDWLIDASGKVLGQSEYYDRSDTGRLKLRAPNGLLRTVDLPAGAQNGYFIGLGQGAKSVLVGYELEEKEIIAEILLDTMSWGPPLTDTTVDLIVFDPATHEALGYASLVDDETRYTFFDPADQKAWRSVLAAFPGESVGLKSISDDHKRFLVLVDSPTEGVAYALVDLGAKTAVWLGAAYADLAADDISPVAPVTYKAADGLEITGYLTTPKGLEPKGLPLIVLPHGGPASRDYPGFDWWSQALASRGYAVLQPNFRGSDGFGRAFLEAGHGEWGKKMQTDLSDGVRDLAAKGVIDPKRVCIVGASYGGYAALAGATVDVGVYRCAVSVAGPSDLKRMLTIDRRTKGVSALRYWSRFMGVDGARDPDLALISPAALAHKVDIPVLLIHGKDDVVVPFEQSALMAEAMRKADKPVELVTLDGEDHWLSRSETRLQMLTSLVAFLEKHNPPNPPAQTASLP